MFGFWEMLVYIAVILVGFFYVWKKGVSTGERHHRVRRFLCNAPRSPITDIEELTGSSGLALCWSGTFLRAG